MLEEIQKCLSHAALAQKIFSKNYKFQSEQAQISIWAIVCILVIMFLICLLLYWKMN